jgi:uroporphyrinogen decarboxylase
MQLSMFRSSELEAAKEDMDALFAHQRPKRVPNGTMWYAGNFAVRNSGQQIGDVFEKPQVIYDAILWSAEQYQWNPYLQFVDFSVLGCLDFGGTMTYPRKNGEYLAQETYPVTEASDIEKLRLPDPRTTGDIPRQLQFAAIQKDAGLPIGFMSRSPFCMAANMCGMTLFMTWLIEEPDLIRQMMDLAYQHILQTLEVWVSSFGAENLQVWWTTPMESNQLVSPKHMESFALPYLIKYGKHIEEIGVKQFGIHPCGEQNKNLPILAEADPWQHPAIISFGPEVDIVQASEVFPEDIIFGNLDTVLMEKGTPEEIYSTCSELLEKGKRIKGGFILAPGCDPPVFTPPTNMYAMTKAVADHGDY